MEKITLIKDNQKRVFSPRAAQIAKEHLGWSEFQPLPKPVELNKGVPLKRVSPPLITKPIATEYPGDEKKVDLIPEPGLNGSIEKTIEVNTSDISDLTSSKSPLVEKFSEAAKKTRKSRVRSKSTK